MPEAREPPPRRDDTAADMGSLVALGHEEPPPVPAPSTNPFLEPPWPLDDEPA